MIDQSPSPTPSPTASLLTKYRSDAPFLTLLNLYRHDWPKLVESFGFFLIKHSPEWVRPLIIANVVDIVAQPSQHSLHELWLNGALLAVMIAQNLPTHYLHIRATRQMEANLRSAMTQRLQELSMGFHWQRSTGVLQAKLLQDVEKIEQLTSYLFQFVPSAVLTIIIAISITARRAPWFLLFFLATVPAAVLLIWGLRKPMRDRNHTFRRQVEGMSANLSDALKLIPITRAHGVEAEAMRRTNQQLEAVKQAGLCLDTINAITNASTWVVLRSFNALCLITAAWLAYQGRQGLTAGDVVLLSGYFDTLTTSTVMILTVMPQISTGFEAIRSVGEVLECPDLEQNQGKLAIAHVQGNFRFDQVGFAYPHQVHAALHNISLIVPPGQTIALVGPSGAGKSTFINLVIGFLRPTQGTLYLDGQDMNGLDLRTYRRWVSVVSQDTILFEGTVRENILYGTDSADEQKLHWAIEAANADEFIHRLPQGLDTLIGENGAKLSGGQRQRLTIARALIRDPRVLILDEATASLDTASESLIQSALQQLMGGRTTFVVAHRLSTIRRADQIVVLNQGQIVEVGTHPELLKVEGLYASLHRLQS
ncbi:ABC transporter ATP-binding protein [Nodosilinea nodulosa]|uniref:ABC transporter ATP-binding protein n=1 Tax=Nodosilinea nodulosa TaxID=416001 RepID=UPI0002F1F463|nr:ABC transporter ATP-binding protein [Nodosilinea nodulosa]